MRVQIDGPDDIMRAYIILSEQLAAPKTQTLTEKIGEICKSCKRGPSTWVGVEPDTFLVCTHCAKVWDGEDVLGVRQFGGKAPRRELSESVYNMLEQWRMVRALVEDRPSHFTKSRWDYVTLCLCAFLDPRIGTYENVATYGAQRFPRRRWLWSPARARTAVMQARAELAKRGLRTGLLQAWKPRKGKNSA